MRERHKIYLLDIAQLGKYVATNNDISAVLKEEQYKLNDEINSLTQADEHFSIALGTVLSLESNAYDIFSSSQVETKRAILNIVLANFKLDGQKFSYDLRKPFDWMQFLNKHSPKRKVLQLVSCFVRLTLRLANDASGT